MRSFGIVAAIGPLLSGFLVLTGSCAAFDGNSTCASLADALQLENTTIISITHVSANTTVATAGSCQSTAQVSSDLCRVFAQVNTTSSSSVKFEMWLPDEWFGRFITVGNGGLGGCIDYSNLDYTSSFHFAAIGSDNGHDGDTGVFFLDHPEVINDFAFRAIHVSAELGKDIVQQYYNATPAKSYYLGCSTGGRQGMKSALMFPDDFDGIMAGSPASDFNHLVGWSGLLSRAIGAPGTSSPSFIPDSLFPTVSAAILKQCDLLDGVQDGIITEPDECFFDPSVLLCGTSTAGNDTNSCLTADQIEALNKIYSPVVSSEGVVLFPRLDPLAENQTSRELFFSGSIFEYTDGWWPNAVVDNTNFSFTDFGVKDLEFADTINPGGIATFDGNFSEYRARGGKIVTYHGRFDGLIASGQSKRLRNLISSTLTPSNLDDFYRLFLVPGMEHCTGGPRAFNCGQDGTSLGVAKNDCAHNGLLALVE